VQKIPNMLSKVTDAGGRVHMTKELNPKCAWVLDPDEDVTPTVKLDGTAVLVRTRSDGGREILTRRQVKSGKQPPAGFELVETDKVTGHQFGWEPYEQSGWRKFIDEAALRPDDPDGTYELIGPKINGNPENVPSHCLVLHGTSEPRTSAGIHGCHDWSALLDRVWWWCEGAGRREGIVFYGSDGKRAKLKLRDIEDAMEVQR
jgi:hypothetical protein